MNYYKYTFESPERLIAIVKEKFKSFFDTGAIDDTMFPIYLSKCLDRLGRGSYRINSAILTMDDFQGRLPDDFYAVREAWLCTDVTSAYVLPGADYQQVESTTTRIDTPDVYCDKCNECGMPDIIKAAYKTTHTAFAHYKKQYLLKPGTIWSKGECAEECANFHSNGPDSFDIHDNKFTVTFREGKVYLVYYSKSFDCNGYEMIPDNYRLKEFIEAFLKMKVYEQVVNNNTDEGLTKYYLNQLDRYTRMADEAYIIADIEKKKETVYDINRKIIKDMNRFKKYEIR